MNDNAQHEFVAGQYGPRAEDYVSSAVHREGADLDQLEALLRGHAQARVLDIGCGGGHVSYRAASHVAEVISCDVTPAMLQAVQRTAAGRGLFNIAVREAAAEALPFEDSAFDFVLCRFSAHHWQDLHAGLREAARVCRPRGVVAFIDTIAPAEPLFDSHLQAVELLRDGSHVRNYTLAEWVAALQRSRLEVTGLTLRRLAMEFGSWVARTRTPALHVDAIRSLQRGAPASVRHYFEIAAEGSFTLDTMTVTAMPLPGP